MPGQPEVAAGAAVEGDPVEVVFNEQVLRMAALSEKDLEPVVEQKRQEIADRREKYLRGRDRVSVTGKTAVVVDDGVATGATMRAALVGLARQKPARIVLALPVAPADALELLEGSADRIVCLETPEPFYAVGAHYSDFRQVSDDEVVALMDAYMKERKET